MNVCVHTQPHARVYAGSQSPGKGVGSLGAGVTGGCELPSVGTKKFT